MGHSAVKKVENKDGLLLIMSPIKIFEGKLNMHDMVTEEVGKMQLKKMSEHLKRCVKLYRMQAENGAYFMHENLEIVDSWNCQEIKGSCAEAGIEKFKYLGTRFAQKKGGHLKVQRMCYMTKAAEIV